MKFFKLKNMLNIELFILNLDRSYNFIDVVIEVSVTRTNRGKQIRSEGVTNQTRNSINSVSWSRTTIPLRNGLSFSSGGTGHVKELNFFAADPNFSGVLV